MIKNNANHEIGFVALVEVICVLPSDFSSIPISISGSDIAVSDAHEVVGNVVVAAVRVTLSCTCNSALIIAT